MKFSDLLIDLNDVYGRLIPGMFLMIDLYLIVRLFAPIYSEQILGYMKEYFSISVLFVLMFLVVCHIVGELSINIIFRLKRVLRRHTPLEIVESNDVTKKGDLVSFFESKFSREALSSGGGLMGYCKDYLLENSFPAYIQSRKVEARINLMGGMVIPLIILMGVCFSYKQWCLGLLSLMLSVLFFDKFRKSFRGEEAFIYNAYYNCWRRLEREDRKLCLERERNKFDGF